MLKKLYNWIWKRYGDNVRYHINDECLWYRAVEEGTTGEDVNSPDHPLYMCKECEDRFIDSKCEFYRSELKYYFKNRGVWYDKQ